MTRATHPAGGGVRSTLRSSRNSCRADDDDTDPMSAYEPLLIRYANQAARKVTTPLVTHVETSTWAN